MPAKPAPKDDTTIEEPPRKRGGRLAMILGLPLGAAAFAGMGFGAGWFLYAESNSPLTQALRMIDRPAEAATAAPRGGMPALTRRAPDGDALQTTYFTFDEPLTTNPKGSRRFIQLGVTLSTQYDAKVMDHVRKHQAALRSDMLAVIGGFSDDEMTGREGREALAAALRDAINSRLEAIEGFGGVEGVFFPSFVLQ